ncbi:unnamed protein product, partial [Onchocerca ochengi]|uniref:Translation initiation factor IF-2 n=1 Tax=Onchocerca ochengi TaxID=42157 RepID=A0A182EEQ0_ONCOC
PAPYSAGGPAPYSAGGPAPYSAGGPAPYSAGGTAPYSAAAPAPAPISAPSIYDGTQRVSGPQTYGESGAPQQPYRDNSVDSESPPANPPAPARFAEGIEQVSLPDGGTIDLASLSSSPSNSQTSEATTQETTQQSTSRQTILAYRRSAKLRHWRY